MLLPALLAACSPSGDATVTEGLRWLPCGDGFLCATLARDEGPLEVTWHPAAMATPQVIAMGQGGPGGSSIDLLHTVLDVFAPYDPDLWSNVNWIAMDNRGTGGSDPLDCVDASWFDALRQYEPVPADEDAAEALGALRTAFQAGCLADRGLEGLAALGTPTTADDLDAFREAYGADLLDFIGYSYGTWLGAVYAGAYPAHVGRFVLDAIVAPDLTRDEFLASQADGFETALERFFDRCSADPGCPIAADPAGVFDALLADAGTGPLPAPGDPDGRSLVRNDLRWGVATLLYGPDDEALGDALAEAADGDATALLAAADAGWGRDPDTGDYSVTLQGYWAIGCLDAPWPAGWTDDDVFAFGAALDVEFPRLGSTLLSGELTCSGWPVSAAAPSVAAPDAPPLLLVNGLWDPATPFDGALALQDALANDSPLLTFEGDGHVAMFSDATGCTYDGIRSFLLDGVVPSGGTCP